MKPSDKAGTVSLLVRKAKLDDMDASDARRHHGPDSENGS